MVYVYRGAGILILVFFFICAWLTSYSFEDTRLGNGAFMGWSMIWTSIPTLLLYFIIRAWPASEPAPGEIPTKTTHSFMFVPVLIWPILLAGGGYYFVHNSGDSESDSDSDYAETNSDLPSQLEGERIINFWNPHEDSVLVDVIYSEDGSQRMNENIGAGGIIYATYDADHYTFVHGGKEKSITVHGSDAEGEHTYSQAWYVLDKEIDLILLNVTSACSDTINREELEAMDWQSTIIERYTGDQLIELEISLENENNKLTVVDPGFDLPLEKEKGEKVYSLIPIRNDLKTTEEYLDSMIIELCY